MRKERQAIPREAMTRAIRVAGGDTMRVKGEDERKGRLSKE
jgi:hypothetical protein